MKNKSLYSLLTMLFIAVVISSCGNKDSNDSSEASTPLDASCVNGSTACNGSAYSQYPYTNYNAFHGGGYGANGWCGCPVGSLPVYNSINGAGCIRQQVYNNMGASAGFYFYFGANWQVTPASYMNRTYAPNNNHWVNIPQFSGYQGYPQGYAQTGHRCSGGALRSCQINAVNSCPAGYACRQAGAATNLGICININSWGNSNW